MGLLVAVVGNVLALKGWGGFAIYRFRPRFDPASRDNWNAFVMVAQAPEPIFSTGLVASFAARHAVVDLVATAVQHIDRTAILAAPVAPFDDCIGGSEAPAAVSGQILFDHPGRFAVVTGMADRQGTRLNSIH